MTDPAAAAVAAARATKTTPALPPPDKHMLELEHLLRLAKVGTHELTSGETSPSAGVAVAAAAVPKWTDFPQSSFADAAATAANNKNAVDADDLTWRLNESINNSNNNVVEEEDEIAERAVAVVQLEESSASSESSGVLVEAPPPLLDEVVRSQSENKTKLVPFQPTQQLTHQSHQSHQLSRFQPTTAATATPKFQFFSTDGYDETKIPKQLNAIQQQSVRNRQAFQSRIHEVEIKIAYLTARLANAEMDRQVDVRNAVPSCIHQPLQAVLDKISITDNQPTTLSLTSRWIEAERQYSALEAKIYHGIHVELEESKPSKVDLDGLAVEIREESLVTAKKEGSVARRWEAESGVLARRFIEERTARIAALELVGNQLNSVDHRRGQELLETIRELRRKLHVERDERIVSDESALDYIVKSTEAVKRAILEAYTDSDPYDD